MAEFKARLVDRDGNPLGTAANPLKISGGGSGDGTWNGYTRPASVPLYVLRYAADGMTIEAVEPTAGSQVNSDWNASTGVASILNKPSIPAAQVQTDWNATEGLGVLLNKPSLITAHTDLSGRDVASQHPASCITTDTTNFNLNLSAADDTVQKALDTLDALIAGGGDVTISAKAKVAVKKGQAVFITPGTAAIPDVDLCDNTDVTKSRVLGVMTADVAAGGTGSVRRYGTLTNVDTRTTNTYVNPNGETWVEGDLLFATTGGGLTKVRPTSGRVVKVGYSVTGSKTTDTIVLFPMENPVWITAATGENVVLRLGDSAGANSVSIRNYANTVVASIGSDGLVHATADNATKWGNQSLPATASLQYFRWNAAANAIETAAVSSGSPAIEYITRTIEGVVYETTLMPWVAPAAGTISYSWMYLSSNPSATGSYCKVQLMKNGLMETHSVFSSDTAMQITEGTTAVNDIYPATGIFDPASVSIAAGDVLNFRVNQADTGSADLMVRVKITYS